MLLNNYLKFSKQETYLLILLFFISVLVRIPVVLIAGDTTIENEWNPLLENLVKNKILAIKDFDGFLLPNLLMPPLYAYYLYVFTFLNLEGENFILTILISQVFLASLSTIVFFKINKIFFSKKISFYSSIVFSLFPIYLYSCTQISSITLTIFLSMLFYYFFFRIKLNKKFNDLIIFAILSGLLILLRREFIIIAILSWIYLFMFCNVDLKKILILLILTIITISPYLIRNIIIFDQVILQAGTGYNLWKANNPNSKVEGYEVFENNKLLMEKINNITKDKFYRINEDKIFMDEAFRNIKSDPKRYLILYFKKIFSFFFIDFDSSYKNYYHPLHVFPVFILSIISLVGIITYNKKSILLNYLSIIICFYIFFFSIFAIQPRYKIYIIPFQIIFSTVLISSKFKRIINVKSS